MEVCGLVADIVAVGLLVAAQAEIMSVDALRLLRAAI